MDWYFQAGVAAVALGVAFWPQMLAAFRRTVSWPRDSVPATEGAAAPSYRDAIYHLAQVRLRLRATGVLDDQRKQAIDSLTLALVEGSDK